MVKEMKKYIKWILLSILITSIVITIILFINFIKEKNNSSNNQNIVNNEKTILEKFYNRNLYFLDMTISEKNQEIFRTGYTDGRYIIINSKTIEYCYSPDEDCKIDNYTYNNDTINISTSNSLGPGDYKIDVIDEKLKLSRQIKGKTISYYFEAAKG